MTVLAATESRRSTAESGRSLASALTSSSLDVAPGLWGVILAGGQGARLRSLTRVICGDERPKQYVTLTGSRSLLQQTLHRTALRIPSERTVVVSLEAQAAHLAAAMSGQGASVLLQPVDRGTAAGVLLPAHWIHNRAPGATVALFPSDHLILEEEAFMRQVVDVAAFVEENPTRIVLLGVPATTVETEYGWIELGPPVGQAGATTVRAVRRFVEKPSAEIARAFLAGAAAWNTFVFVAKANTLVEAGRRCLPRLHAGLHQMVHGVGRGARPGAIRRTGAALPTANFSRDVLQQVTPILTVATLTGVTWCDWGSPHRVLQSLERLGIRPPWLDRLTEPVGTGPAR